MLRNWFFLAAALVALLCFGPLSLSAQITGAIEGTLTDSSKAAIPGATVKLTDEKTGVDYTTTTNSSGYFLVENLPVGVYSIAVSQPGFKAYSVKGVIL